MPVCAVAELKSGKKLEAGLVVVGVGAKPNTDMFKGQIDLLEDKPGGIKVLSTSYHPMTRHHIALCAMSFLSTLAPHKQCFMLICVPFITMGACAG